MCLRRAWSNKRERQYQHVKQGAKKQGASTKRAKEMAARAVNKERARSGEARTSSRTSRRDMSSGRRGGLRSGTSRTKGRTKEQLYNDAKRMNIRGRSRMNKQHLQRAVSRRRVSATRSRVTILPGSVRPKTLDHVAYWTDDRDRIADFVTTHLGMHVIEHTDRFTLVGSDARRGKLTLFDAEGPREPGALKHVALRVNDLDAALQELPVGMPVERDDGTAIVDLGAGIRLGLVEAETDTEYDLDHVALFSADPEATAAQYREYGFDAADRGAGGAPRVEVSGAYVEFHEGDPGDPEKPLLNHLAVLVDSAEEHQREAGKRDIEVQDFVDAPNTLAVFVWLPEHVRLEYVEHKPTFALQ